MKRALIIFLWVAALFAFLRWEKPEKNQKHLNVFTWSNAIPPARLAAFKEKTGIDVHLSYFTSNEEMLTKMQATGGRGYDLIIVSDYAVPLLQNQELLRKIDKARIERFGAIDPLLTGHTFDPDNAYSIPMQWDALGIGYNTDLISEEELDPSIALFFQERGLKTSITNDPIEVINLASFHLFGKTGNLTPAQIARVEKLLCKQKKWVESYSTMRADYTLSTKNVPVALSMSSYLLDAENHTPSIRFQLPDEGTFLSIESFALPAASDKTDAAYAFLNFCLEEDELRQSCDTFTCFPSTPLKGLKNQEVYEAIKKQLADPHYPRLFYHHSIPESTIRSLWIKVKS